MKCASRSLEVRRADCLFKSPVGKHQFIFIPLFTLGCFTFYAAHSAFLFSGFSPSSDIVYPNVC